MMSTAEILADRNRSHDHQRRTAGRRAPWKSWLPFGAQITSLLITGILIIPPLGMLILGSLTDTEPGVAPHFTTNSLLAAYGSADTLRSLGLTLIFASFVASLSMGGGAFLAWLSERTDAPLGRVTYLLPLIPLLIPGVSVIGGWLMLLGPGGGLIAQLARDWLGMTSLPFSVYSLPGMIFLATLQELPLAFLWLWPAFRTLNPALEEAARMSGASGLVIMRRITLPLLAPALLSGWLICFVVALGALSVPLMVGLPAGIVLYSTEIYLAVNRFPADLNIASALCLFYVLLTFIGILHYARTTRDTARFNTISARGYDARRVKLGLWRLPAAATGWLVLLLIAVFPALILIWNALMPYPQPPSLAGLSRITFENFVAVWNYGPAMRAVGNSLLLGVASGIITTFLGLVLAWQLLRGRHVRLARIADQLATAPIAMPGVLLGVALLWLYVSLPLPIYGTRWILLIAYVTLHLPYAVRICVSALAQVHRDLDDAAVTAGANTATSVRRIVAPLIASSLLVSVVYVALRSFREYAASIFLVGVGTEVFSVLVIDMWGGGNGNILAAYVTAVMVLLTVCGGGLQMLASRYGIRL